MHITNCTLMKHFMYGLLMYKIIISGWVTLTFFGESVRMVTSQETNETLTEPVPRLPLKAWYPFNAMSGSMYILAFVFQVRCNFLVTSASSARDLR